MTTASQTSNRPTTTPNSAKPRRRKVNHLFWVDAMKFAAEYGLQMRSLCGVWKEPDKPRRDEDQNVVEFVGGTPLPKPEDCKRCLRVLEANWRRETHR
jgi:hypothetical protein